MHYAMVAEAAMLDWRVTGKELAEARRVGAKMIFARDDRYPANIERGGPFTDLQPECTLQGIEAAGSAHQIPGGWIDCIRHCVLRAGARCAHADADGRLRPATQY